MTGQSGHSVSTATIRERWGWGGGGVLLSHTGFLCIHVCSVPCPEGFVSLDLWLMLR